MDFPVVVKYKAVDDWHIYICDSFPGFYVASRNKEKARNDIVPSLNKLIELDTGVDIGLTEDSIIIV
jgi:hypothetical protein